MGSVVVTCWVVGCGSSESSERVPCTDPTCAASGGAGNVPGAQLTAAPGIQVTQVAVYQGVKRVLWPATESTQVPLVAGRDTLLRVFYQTDAAYDGSPLVAKLALADGQDDLQLPLQPAPASVEGDLTTTVNFVIPGARVGATLDYSVVLGSLSSATENPAARSAGTLVVEGKANTFRVMLVPFAYDADGSGRLPDTSEAAVASYRERLLGMYPVSNVEVSLHAPVSWASAIAANGNGWQQVGLHLYNLRQQEQIADDVYLYGVFMPRNSLYEFCGAGCLLGVTLLNDTPTDVGNVGLRLALGVGFPETTTNTAAHELGHAHGRRHANCGPGLDPQSVDPTYPHAGASIGDWGWDLVRGALKDPAQFKDIMSYCDPQWISGYNYSALYARMQNVNLPSWQASSDVRFDYWMASIGPDGHATWQHASLPRPVESGREIEVEVRAAGIRRQRQARLVRWDHMPGGFLFVPDDGSEFQSLEWSDEGVSRTLEMGSR